MKITVTSDIKLQQEIRTKLKANDGYCPCAIERTVDSLCMCKDFRENVKAGEYCHCGLYFKVEQ